MSIKYLPVDHGLFMKQPICT